MPVVCISPLTVATAGKGIALSSDGHGHHHHNLSHEEDVRKRKLFGDETVKVSQDSSGCAATGHLDTSHELFFAGRQAIAQAWSQEAAFIFHGTDQ